MPDAGDEAGLLLDRRARSPARIASRRVSMPSPVSAETRDRSCNGTARARSTLVRHDQRRCAGARSAALHHPRQRLRRIQDDKRQIGIGHSLIAALDAELFHAVLALRECPRYRRSVTGMPSSEAVSETRSRVVPGMSVTMARSCSSSRLNRLLLPTFGRPTIASVKPFVHQLAVGEACGEAVEPSWIGASRRRISVVGRDVDVVFGEVDAGFEQRDQLEQLLLERRDPPRNGALHLLRGDARLVERGGVDQVADSFGLRQIDAAVQIAAQRELAGLGGPSPGAARARSTQYRKHDRRAMAGDLDDVFGGVGSRRCKERRRPPGRRVAARSSIRFRERRGPGFQVCSARKRRICSAMRRASAPERRTTPIPARARGVEMATIVSCKLQLPSAAARTERPPALDAAVMGMSGGIDDHLTLRAQAGALAAQRGFVAKREMDDAPLAAVHRVEAERQLAVLHFFRRGERAQPQFFDAQQAVIVGVEGDARMVL